MKQLLLASLVLQICLAVHGGDQRRELPNSKSHYVLHLPKNFDKDKKYPLLVALHGMGDTAENFAAIWRQLLKSREVILAVPEGSKKLARGYSWNTDDLAVIEECVADVTKTYGIEDKKIALTGFSAGSAIGFYVLCQRPKLFNFFGALGMSWRPDACKDEEMKEAAKHVAVYFMIGKKDFNYRAFEPRKKQLADYGFRMKAEDLDVAHTINGDVAKALLAFWDETSKAGEQKEASKAAGE